MQEPGGKPEVPTLHYDTGDGKERRDSGQAASGARLLPSPAHPVFPRTPLTHHSPAPTLVPELLLFSTPLLPWALRSCATKAWSPWISRT